MFSKLLIVALFVLALSIKVEGACDATFCDSDRQRLLRADRSNLQEVCQAAHAYLDCAERVVKDCGLGTSPQLESARRTLNNFGCGSAGKLFSSSPLLILLLFLSKSVN